MSILKILLQYLIFPGFLFTAVMGMLASWVDRKVTARVQWRVGPPWYQPFADALKLLGKEIIVPAGGSKLTFLLSPLLGLSAVTLVSVILWMANANPGTGFLGDLIVVIYLLVIPAISVILGGFASKNPIASLGASREMKLVLAYELPFILAVFTPVIKANGAIRLGEIVAHQAQSGLMLSSPSCILAFIVAILCMQAKLGLVPFDMAEAETEIIAGPYVEYSGAPLAVLKLTKQMLLFVMPVFLVTIFLGGIELKGIAILWSVLKYAALLLVVTLIRNTSPRVRIDQAVKFFWGPVTLLAIIGVALAVCCGL